MFGILSLEQNVLHGLSAVWLEDVPSRDPDWWLLRSERERTPPLNTSKDNLV